jgi:hypothetical protein
MISNIVYLIILVFITHIMVIFFHELAHKKEFHKNNIKCDIKWNLPGIKLLKNFALARCFFDKDKFDKLGKDKKRKILFSGIKTEAIILLIFLFLSVYSWIYFKNSFVFYYFNLSFFTLVGKLVINFFGNESDGGKLRKLRK